MMTRRHFSTTTLVAAALQGLGCRSRASTHIGRAPPLTDKQIEQTLAEAQHGLAVDLGVLLKVWQACPDLGRCPTAVRELGGLRRINGYFLDREKSSVILIGKADPALPPLFTEDLAVAVRAASHVYAQRKGNTLYYSDPAVSIDPQPQVMQQLERIERALGAAAHEDESALKAWEQTCQAPMAVRVVGMPFETRFAQTAVLADYAAKRLLDGKSRLRMPGFDSVPDRNLAAVIKAFRSGTRRISRTAGINRIWFAASDLQFLEDDGAVLIGSPFHVVVKTEAELMKRNGELKGTGAADPTVDAWTKEFTSRYRDIARERPLYAQLEGLFRLVAVAKIAAAQKTLDQVSLPAEFLLREAPIPRAEVPRELAGCFNVRRHAESRAVSGGEERFSVVMPSCGGVGFDAVVRPGSANLDRSRRLLPLVAHTRTARREPRSLSWEY